ncbi:uncharacterized protein LOC105189583 [Harpegnathos saltator]|uniref:Uncharacterized protein n=1 Tax=Harpegnathos saltator TaxID=610380 RepID=E2B647_HARSA|nr:uncharacterized protein LOC105189583 [Harpegnathos saltator]EFN88836.1 hypothetical protein EAI_08421 [Harpegnathos saltator]
MSILEDREDYLKNPYFKEHEYGDYTPFYATVAFCAVLGGFLFILNIVFCWCSRHREYWQDRNTGNRWIQPMWTVLPHKTPPLDLSELESGRIKYPQVRHEIIQYHDPESHSILSHPEEYLEMQKRESEI